MKNLRYIPAIDRLQQRPEFLKIQQASGTNEVLLTEWLKEIIDELRTQIIADEIKIDDDEIAIDVTDDATLYAYIFDNLTERVSDFTKKNKLQRVINATGVVIHTNLGRSRLSEEAIKQVTETAHGYSTLEYEIATGKRGSRHDIVEDYIVRLTGAEAAIVVNNNAAAVYFVLKALAENKEVIVSRGELVEIGGSFRISEIMELSGATLVEVGTTNKTNITDYRRAITEETGMILKVHKSNFAIVGFTEEVMTEDLVEVATKKNIPIYEDLGSGTLFNFANEQIGNEPTVQQQVAKGIDLISFSGDKLLGGPQAGIIVGKKKYINQLKRHQLARVLRVDKFTLASLEATLKTYIANNEREKIPTIRDITETADSIKRKAEKFIENVQTKSTYINCTLCKGESKVGGGTMPDVVLPTYVVEVTHETMTSSELAKSLRKGKTPIIVRVRNEAVQLDLRTVTEEELIEVIAVFQQF